MVAVDAGTIEATAAVPVFAALLAPLPLTFRMIALPADVMSVAPLVGTAAAIFTAVTAALERAAAAVVLYATAVVLIAVPTPRLGPPIIMSVARRDATSESTMRSSAARAMQKA